MNKKILLISIMIFVSMASIMMTSALTFQHNGTNTMTLDNSGNLIVLGNITTSTGDICIAGGTCLSQAGTGTGDITSVQGDNVYIYNGSNSGAVFLAFNISKVAAVLGNWSMDKVNYFTKSDIVGFNYYNSTTLQNISQLKNNNGYYNSSTLTSNTQLSNGNNYYNSSTLNINNYYLKSNPFGYFNITTEGNIKASLINNDLNWVNATTVNESFVPYIGANKNVVLGNNNLSVNGSALFVNTNIGNVGIGTTLPSYKLDVSGYIRSTSGVLSPLLEGNTIQPFSTGSMTLRTYPGTGSSIIFNTTGTTPTESVIIDSNGYVGIGTSSPQNTLNVIGTGNFTNGLYVNNKNVETGYNYATNGTYYLNTNPAGYINWSQVSNGTIALNSTFSNYFTKPQYYSNATSEFYLKSNPSGYTTNASALKYVNSSGLIINWNSTGFIKNWNSTGLIINWSNAISPGTLSPWTNNSNQIFLANGYPNYINESNLLFVNGTSGRVGIGTSTPQNTLNVVGSFNATGNVTLGQGAAHMDIYYNGTYDLFDTKSYDAFFTNNVKTNGNVISNGFVNATKDICIAGGTCLSQAGTGSGDITSVQGDNAYIYNGSNSGAVVLAFNITKVKDVLGNWTADKTNYFTKSDILGFNYYNSTTLNSNSQLTNGNNYWNDTYATFNKTYADTLYYGINNPNSYYNSTTLTSNSQLLNGNGYYNISSFNINNYYLKSNPFGFYNSTTLPTSINQTYANNTYYLKSNPYGYYNSTTLTSNSQLLNGNNYYNSTTIPFNINDYLLKSEWNATNTSYYLASNPSGYINWNQATNGTLALSSAIPTNNNQLINGNGYYNSSTLPLGLTWAEIMNGTLYLSSNPENFYNSTTLTSNTQLANGNNYYNSTTIGGVVNTSYYVPYTGAANNLNLGTHNLTVGSTALFVNGNLGNVGIGTTSLSQQLTVNGGIQIGNAATATAGTIRWTGSQFQAYNGTDWNSFGASGSGSLWSRNGTSLYYSSGSVGIGTSNPSALFSVGSSNQFIVDNNGNVNASGNVFLNPAGSSTSSPRTFGFSPSFSSGQAARLTFGDPYNAIQNAYNDAMQIYSYHQLILSGGRATATALSYVTGQGSSYNTRVINTNTATVGLTVEGPNGQTGDLQRWIVNGNTLGVVNGSGSFGIGTSSPQNTLNVIGTGNFTNGLYVNNKNVETGYNYATNGTYYLNSNPYGYYNSTTIPNYLLASDWNATNTSYYLASNPSGYINWNQAANGTLALSSAIPTNNNQLINGNNYYNSTTLTSNSQLSNGNGYYNSSSFNINNYYLKSNPYGFYNSSTIPNYLLASQWNATNTSYYLKSNPYGFYNSTDFVISNYYLKSNPYGYYNSTTLPSGLTWSQVTNGTLALNSTFSNYFTKSQYYSNATSEFYLKSNPSGYTTNASALKYVNSSGLIINWSNTISSGTLSPWANNSAQVFLASGYPNYINASNTLFVNGTSRNVGIGTISPSYNLDINGSLGVASSVNINPTGVLGDTNSIFFTNARAAVGYNGAISTAGTYIQSGSGKYINFMVNGATTPSAVIDSSGNVGIGTTSPAYPLDVKGTVNAYNLLINGTPVSAGSSGGITSTGSTNYIPYFTNSTNLGNSNIYQSGGNIGIGTTSTHDTLTVSGGVDAGNGALRLTTSSGINYLQSGASYTSGSWNPLYFGPYSSATGIKMAIDASGNVGIGTTSPSSKLEINTGASNHVNFFNLSNWNLLAMNGNITATGATGIESGATNSLYIDAGKDTTGNGDMYLRTQGTTTRLFINGTTGNVGIGTTAPSYNLDVAGTGRFTGALTSAGLTSSGTTTLSGLTANRLVATGSSKQLTSSISAANLLSSVSGTTGSAGNLVFSSSPTITGTLTTAALTASGTATFSGLTASRLVATGSSKQLASSISAANLLSSVSGTTGSAGNLVFSGGPTFTGTTNAATISASGTVYGNAMVVGHNSGDVSLTYNDGYGNANIAFNHQNGVPDESGSAARITSGVDSSTGYLEFEVGNSVTSGTAVTLSEILNLQTSGITAYKNLDLNSNDITNVNKITATTSDPLYTINGSDYATYLPGMSGGTKEEVSETANLKLVSQNESQYIINFNNLTKGSDLWLFYQVTNFGQNMSNLQVILTPGFNGRVWYTKDANANILTIHGTAAGEVSYRLTSNRFDNSKWPNAVNETGGVVVPPK